jgi:RHS repeat-associated protein
MAYDQNYWLTDVGGSVLNLHFCRDSVANITRLKTTTPACSGTATEQYAYDALYRLTQVQTGSGSVVEAYTYNLTGDRQSKTVGTTPQTYKYANPFSSHRLLNVGSDGRDYDAVGNRIDGTSPSRTQNFNRRNRLSQDQAGSALTTYNYNGRGERVVKNGSAGAHYVYDEAGHLLTDHGNGNPNPTDYVYVDERPIALVRSGVIDYVHTDQLGSPRAVTAAGSATPLWSWAFQGNPFGAQAPVATLTVNLRFPGQYADAESGLSYNYFRDYEAGTGRYVEIDPIGLGGGLSTYTYSFSAPLRWMDKNGLSSSGSGGCCAQARRQGDFRNPAGQGEDWGIVECCNGKKVACANVDPNCLVPPGSSLVF